MLFERQAAHAVILAACMSLPATIIAEDQGHFDADSRRVLLISIDGMHPLDYLNCSQGIPGINSGQPYCPNLAKLGEHGVNYTDTTTSKPSDSFPGLMAIVSGGSPRTFGAFYDVAYDRSLNPPATATGNNVAGGPCTAGATPSGTTTEYEEGIDLKQSELNGVNNATLATFGGGVASIDPDKLPRDGKCNPIYPWNFVRTNTIFGVIHAAGGYTAWSDKHPSYSSVSGPGPGMAENLNDYYSPEVNSQVIGLPGVTTPTHISCNPLRDSLQTGSWTDSFQNIQCYDTLKVYAILNEIKGKTHDGKKAQVPNIFGMNFQAVSVGQKLIEYNDATKTIHATGGYVDGIGTPTASLLGEIEFVDASIGAFIDELQEQGLSNSTLIIITAKHGQSPIDPNRFTKIPSPNTPADILCALLPASESPDCPATGVKAGIGPTQDDVSLLWLKDPSTTSSAVSLLETNGVAAGIGEIFWGPAIAPLFNLPGLPPGGDPRTPDIIVTPNPGVIYTGSKRKLEEHGGFSHDDTNVIMLVSNPGLAEKTVTSPVETAQVAPTILQALGLDPNSLQAVQKEGTQVLPGVSFNFFH
jgi:hypothetical protein